MLSSPYILVPGAALVLCTTLISFALALPRNHALRREFLLLAGCIAGWNLGQVLLYIHPFEGWELVVLKTRSVFPITVGAFFLAFALRLVGRERSRLFYLLATLCGLAAVLSLSTDLVIQGYRRLPWGVSTTPGALHLPAALSSVLGTGIGLCHMLGRYLRSTDRQERAILRLIAVGGTLALLAGLVTEIVLPDLVGLTEVPRLGSPGLAVFAVFVLFAVRRHHFLSLSPAHAALQTEQQRLLRIFDQLPLGVLGYRLDQNDQLVLEMANHAASAILDIDSSRYLGLTIEQAFPGLAATEVPKRYREVAATGSTWEAEELTYQDEAIAGAFEVKAFRTEPGHMVAAFRDITERKRAEAVLTESEQRFRSTFEQAAMGIVHAAPDGRFLRVNERFCGMVGYAREELLGLTFQAITYPPDLDADLEQAKSLREGRIDTFALEKRYVRKNGELIWVNLTASMHRASVDSPGYYIAVIEDISARKQVEQSLVKLSSAVENSPNPTLIMDVEGLIEYVNPALTSGTGYLADEALGQRLDTLFVDERSSEIRQQMWRAVRAGEIWHGELPCRRKNGDEFVALVAIAPVRDVSAQLTNHVAVLQDVSARRQMEQQLMQTQKLQAVGQLTGGVAHDFNNLLTVIMNNLELIGDSLHDDTLRAMVDDALVATERGADLTNQLLAFSRRQALRPKVIDLNQLVARSVKLLMRTLGDTIEITLRASDDLWLTRCDAGQMENALLNLAINARDAMPRGGQLLLETRNAHVGDELRLAGDPIATGDYVVLSLRDSGHGMSGDVLQRVFEPFFTTKEAGRGTGLGLSMVYGFVKQSGGGIELESAEGEGTCVRIYLPRESRPPRSVGAPGDQRDELQGGSETVLVVEDDPDVRQVTVQTLERLGYRVLKADSGPAALAVLSEQPRVDLLFTDVMMPGGLTGLELTRIVRERQPALKILLTTGYSEDVAGRSAELADDSVEILPKPFRPVSLAKTIRRVLDRPAA